MKPSPSASGRLTNGQTGHLARAPRFL